MRCELCGHGFDPERLACHAECPFGPRCSLICCPNCGFQAVDASRSVLARGLGRLWPGRRGARAPGTRPADGVPLAHVRAGATVRVVGLEGLSVERRSRLSAFGLAEGTAVRLVQRRPVPVLRIGETELALAEDIVRGIRVRPEEGDPCTT